MNKRNASGAGLLSGLTSAVKRGAKDDAQYNRASRQKPVNPHLSRPVSLDHGLRTFLITARNAARSNVPKGISFPITKPFCEIEARIGILKSPFGAHNMRVLPSGAKRVKVKEKSVVANAFDCTGVPNVRPCAFEGGITKTRYINWTAAGLSEHSAISSAFGVNNNDTTPLKRILEEVNLLETVYGGYQSQNRVCFDGDHNPKSQSVGKMENKSKLTTMDIALPAAPYDLRLNLSTERVLDASVSSPPQGWTSRRLKRRRSYTRKSCFWQLDVTEVSTTNQQGITSTEYEIEMELNAGMTLKLINETDDAKIAGLCKTLAQQLSYMLMQLNPNSDVLDVESVLQKHPNSNAVLLAQAQCAALKKFMNSRQRGGSGVWESPIAADGKSSTPTAALANTKFPGCMPINFSRHNIEEVQQSDENGGYYLSEKTDGVRYFMVFTGDTVVLVDRTMNGIQPRGKGDGSDPLQAIIPLIKPGTVLDGEVVMHRELRRPVFIVFDVLCNSATEPVLHRPFSYRLQCLRRASFRTPTANRDMFAESAVKDQSIPLPLVRKNFVQRLELDSLLSNVVEEKGERTYKKGETHHHLTDGIIFQPNLPYVCGTDRNLLKWKYLDTVTIDVQIMPPGYGHYNNDDDDDMLVVAVTGEEGSMVDMTRYINLPNSELRKLEADKNATGSNIAEVGLEPTTGEWYYLTMRPDKTGPNHISTVLGTLLELAECLGTEELRYRMSVPAKVKDNYRRDMRKMQKQLLDHQRKMNNKAKSK